MKNKQAVYIQLIIWACIWSVFAFTANQSHFDFNYYISLTIKVFGFILFFNLVYYHLLPLYLQNSKKKFFTLSICFFLFYVLIMIAIDTYFRSIHPEWKKHNPPIMFVIMPPVILGLAIFGSAAAIKGFSELEKKKISEEEANKKRLEAEIKLLKSQINPHFMLNTLNNLYALSLTDHLKTPDAILKLSQMMSYILYECQNKEVLMDQEIEFIKTYISLQKLRLPNNVLVEEFFPENISERYLIEPMILISFIENAFKHGITTKEKCTISINIEVGTNAFYLKVENSVWNQKDTLNENQTGIGLNNTIQRLNHSYKNKYKLTIVENDNKHIVNLDINLV